MDYGLLVGTWAFKNIETELDSNHIQMSITISPIDTQNNM